MDFLNHTPVPADDQLKADFSGSEENFHVAVAEEAQAEVAEGETNCEGAEATKDAEPTVTLHRLLNLAHAHRPTVGRHAYITICMKNVVQELWRTVEGALSEKEPKAADELRTFRT